MTVLNNNSYNNFFFYMFPVIIIVLNLKSIRKNSAKNVGKSMQRWEMRMNI